jgi:hypothetical protein
MAARSVVPCIIAESPSLTQRLSSISSQVWPAFWSKGARWPDNGEIDIIEGINRMENNQMTLHTLAGCTHGPDEIESGSFGVAECVTASGCIVGETKPNSYGAAFAAAGGGVWATRFDSTGILCVSLSYLSRYWV